MIEFFSVWLYLISILHNNRRRDMITPGATMVDSELSRSLRSGRASSPVQKIKKNSKYYPNIAVPGVAINVSTVR